VPIDQEKLIDLIRSAGRLVGLKEILRVGGFDPGAQTKLKQTLRELVRDHRVFRDGKRFGIPGEKPKAKSGPGWKSGPPRHDSQRPARTGNVIEGVIHHHRDGFAFVKPVAGTDSEDIFMPPDEAAKALDHDRVVVEVVPGRGGKTMGRLVEVTSRTRVLVVGTYGEAKGRAWVTPRESELGEIRVPPTQLARPGDAVKVRLGVGGALFEGRGLLTGEVAGSLGTTEDHSLEVLSVAYAKGFHDEFPPDVMDEADRVELEVVVPKSQLTSLREHEGRASAHRAPARSHGKSRERPAPDEEERKRKRPDVSTLHAAHGNQRIDLRELPLVTIDGEDARDFDDAIYVEKQALGWRLVVAIADVSHYVTDGSALDAEALRRATSVYLPSRVIPMLPERLSNGVCSLKPNEDRLAMVADLLVNQLGATIQSDFYPAVIRSHARCTYNEVHGVLGGEQVPGRTKFRALFQCANDLALRLRKMRADRGAIDFDLPETRIQLKADGHPEKMVQRERLESHRLVEECMLAANEAVAKFFRTQGLPTVNRFHGLPDEERLEMFLGLLKAYGVKVPKGEMTSKALNDVLRTLAGHPEERALNQLALRSMMQAVYSSKEKGHYGLGAEDYLHFTSPIRRYPDLLVHRLLRVFWDKRRKHSGPRPTEEVERLESLAVQCSDRERAAMQVEREVNALYACLLMKDRVGEEFAATVCGLSENGFFVELDGLFVEGFVRGESIFPRFEFDPATYRLNFGNGRVVKVGQKAQVVLISVNLRKKQMEHQVIAFEGEERGALEATALKTHGTRRRFGRDEAGAKTGPGHQAAQHGRKPRGRSGDQRDSRSSGGDRSSAAPPRSSRTPRGKAGSRDRDFEAPPSRPFVRGPAKANSSEMETPARDRMPAWGRRREVSPTSNLPDDAPGAAAAEPRSEASPKKFDAREVLDRLWKERQAKAGGSGRETTARREGKRKGR
jgi:ribonuclease R